MPSLALMKLFKGKRDKRPDGDNTKTEKLETQYTSGAKARIASLTNTFRRRTISVSVDHDAPPCQDFAPLS